MHTPSSPPSLDMREPHRARFELLIRSGAANQDIHDAEVDADFASAAGAAADAFIAREMARVAMHARSLVPMLEGPVGRAPRVLDFGCGTGGTTVALALSSALAATHTVGVDANGSVIEAARVRALGHGLTPEHIEFRHVPAGEPLPFPDGSFDLVVTVSVLEFISSTRDRERVVAELRRVVRPGGFLYVATPWPGLREYHSRRWLGDLARKPGMPWATPPWAMASWRAGWQRIPLTDGLAARARARVPWLPAPVLARGLGPVLPYLSRWNKQLLRRPS